MKRYIILLLLIVFSLTACGGDGSSSSKTGETGTVALYLKDAPTDDYDSIWVWIESVTLFPADEDGSPVTVFESDEEDGYKVDLLDLRDKDVILTINDEIPAGEYSKIRLKIKDIQPEGGTGECNEFDVKLPSGKIDLHPDAPFTVAAGTTVSIELDMDANKSINLHTAGSSGKCIFRPVVFVHIETNAVLPTECPVDETGGITGIDYDTDGITVTGFVIDLGDGRGTMDVSLASDTSIFDENGALTDSGSFDVGQTVFVRGRLNTDGVFEASLVAIGGLEAYEGTAKDSTVEGFTIDFEGAADDLGVALTADTLIYRGCEDTFNGLTIPEGTAVKVFGKTIGTDPGTEYRAVLVLFESQVQEIKVTGIETAVDGYTVTVMDQNDTTTPYFLPNDATVKVQGDGPVDVDELAAWVACQPRDAIIKVADDTTNPPTLSQLVVIPEQMTAVVTAKDEAAMTLSTEDGTIAVIQTGNQYRWEDDSQSPITFQDIQVDDVVTVYGITACPDDAISFYAYIVMVLGDDID